MFKEEYNIDFRKEGKLEPILISSIYVTNNEDSYLVSLESFSSLLVFNVTLPVAWHFLTCRRRVLFTMWPFVVFCVLLCLGFLWLNYCLHQFVILWLMMV